MHTTEVGHASAGSKNKRENLNEMFNLQEFKEPFVAYTGKRQGLPSSMLRGGRDRHLITNPRTGTVIGSIPLRAERRRLSRAFAVGEWKQRKAVA